MKRWFSISAVAVVWVLVPRWAVADLLIDGVPLPDDVSIAASTQNSSTFHALSGGAWVRVWGGGPKHVLVIESPAEDDSAKIVYAIGDNPILHIPRQWMRLDAKMTANGLTVLGHGFTTFYALSSTGRLRARVELGELRGYAALTKVDMSTLRASDFSIASTRGKSELLQPTGMKNNKRVQLEVVVFQPPGKGPFPLAVINHGSSGNDDSPALFTETWTARYHAEFLNERGWLVAFPQRRGRGKSQGLYDEGFAVDRAKGYTCDAARTLGGADRASQTLKIIKAVTLRSTWRPSISAIWRVPLSRSATPSPRKARHT